MSGLFSKPKVPAAPPPVQQPIVDQVMVDRQMADTVRRRRGRAAADLTGGGAAESTAGSVATKQLLGA